MEANQPLIPLPVDDYFIQWSDLGKSCLRWAQAIPLQNELAKYRPGASAPPEESLNMALLWTLSAMALCETTTDRVISMNRPTTLGNLHDSKSWTETTFYKFFQECLEEDNVKRAAEHQVQNSASETTEVQQGGTTKSPSPRRRSATSLGPTNPDGMVSWRKSDPDHLHATLVMEFKALAKIDADNLRRWIKEHKGGLAQAIWHLLVCYSICRTRFGLLVVNNAFRRILVDEDGSILMESKDGAAPPRQVRFEECGFNKEDMPSVLSTKRGLSEEDVHPGTPHYRMWQFLVMGLMAAQAGATKGLCSSPPPELFNAVELDHTFRLPNTKDESKPILQSIHTYQRAAAKDVSQAKKAAGGVKKAKEREKEKGREKDTEHEGNEAKEWKGKMKEGIAQLVEEQEDEEVTGEEGRGQGKEMGKGKVKVKKRKQETGEKPPTPRKYGGPRGGGSGGAGASGGRATDEGGGHDDRGGTAGPSGGRATAGPSANTRSTSAAGTPRQDSATELGAASLVRTWRETIRAGYPPESRGDELKTMDSGLGDFLADPKVEPDEGDDLPMEGAEAYWKDSQGAVAICLLESLERKGLLRIKLVSSDYLDSRLNRQHAALSAELLEHHACRMEGGGEVR